ncbi:MAG: hypothetical protein K9H61_00320 [Bacteroidia bacterium]|nr:hypothetical protein [Bacteroidia bacterium]MCF8427203.1 hypothetical protein [Bacteroidia bacterium]MCF8445408.1 hypothetical protein [Bacteroidia bacterium]
MNKSSHLLRKTFLALVVLSIAYTGFAKENIGLQKKSTSPSLLKMGAGCAAATQQKDLDLNNVRTTILNGGDMWWNLQNARYEIPKVESGTTSKHSLFSGALWIGGITQGNLRIAAQTYRQSGNDYYPGALAVDGSASISATRCKYYDKIWKITLEEIEQFSADQLKWNEPIEAISTWPGNGDNASLEAEMLAPFFDNNNNGKYEYSDGDYPSFDYNVSSNIPDMMLFTIYNDKGNIHSETEGIPIGLELHTQSFAYSTSDEINNMTFYRTTIFNRSSETIDSCIFGQWVDADLGNYADDYVECDVKRNLGICYNGDDNDEGILGYGLNPPSVGVNFFEGPRRIIGTDTTEIGLSKFVYYNNDFSVTGNPSRPEHYWNYLNGRWKDGLSITYGGNGRGGTDTASYMFAGKTDPAGRADWTERIAGNNPGDRRFLQTAGTFSLLPGAVNRVTVAVVWARATTGGATGSFNLLKDASDKAYVLYKNNFNIVDGPRVPNLDIVELDREIILNITNYKVTEAYSDSSAGLCADKTKYKFQGYQIFQLKKNATPSDLYNTEEARLVAQCDIQDGSALIVNTVSDADLGQVKKIMVNGEDKGVSHSFRITKDAFSTLADPTIVNFQSYYYLLVAYSSATNCVTDATQYLAGRKMVDGSGLKVWTGIPHKPTPHTQGTELNAVYGDGPIISKIEGIGNGGNALILTQETIDKALLSPYFVPAPSYDKNFGPVMVKVINPFKLPKGNFQLSIIDPTNSTLKADSLNSDSSFWILKNLETEEIYLGETTIGNHNEQVFADLGLSITVSQVGAPGNPDDPNDDTNGFLSATIEFGNPTNQWLVGVADEMIPLVPFNWIRAGNTGTPGFGDPYQHDFADGPSGGKRPIDPRRQYNKILNGTWAPYSLAARAISPQPTFGPAWAATGGYSSDNPLSDLKSVVVVITSDKTKWSRCVVIESGENPATTIGGAAKMNRRKSPSVGKDGKPDGTGSGMSWFPGYAINKETGERLNIMFAEDSSLPLENGTDMIWNPTSSYFKNTAGGQDITFGGKHHIYIMGSKNFRTTSTGPVLYKGPRYDEGASYNNLFTQIENGTNAILNKRYIYSQALWVTIPVVSPKTNLGDLTTTGAIPCEVKININVKRPYASLHTSAVDTPQNDFTPVYQFSTDGIAPTTSTKELGKTALDMVSVTPNPYYAYSGYEDPGNQLDAKVKIINLPTKCVVSIYTQGGFLVRRIKKDDNSKTYIDWNLKNDASVPISSGVYLIHIYADGIGERVIKWFGVIRPADFDTF